VKTEFPSIGFYPPPYAVLLLPLMTKHYASVHLYWASAGFIYFAIGSVLCSVVLSVRSASEELYHGLIIGYTLVGVALVGAWMCYYAAYPDTLSLFSSTRITVKPAKDTEYGVVHELYIKSSFTAVIVTLIFWIWFLIYLLSIEHEQLTQVLNVYCVVLLPFTFLILLFYAASWWIPPHSRSVSAPQTVQFCSKSSPEYIQSHTSVGLHW